MKLKKSQLKQIIKEELESVVQEASNPLDQISDGVGGLQNLIGTEGEWEKNGLPLELLPKVSGVIKPMVDKIRYGLFALYEKQQ